MHRSKSLNMSNRKKITFDEKVLNYVENSRKVDDSILNDHLIKSYDDSGSLLHYAASACNKAIVRQLIDLGSEVDFVGEYGRTPFMEAVGANCSVKLAKIFLKAKASIDIVDDGGRSVLQRALGCRYIDPPLIKLFASKVKTKRTKPNKLATRLVAAGCRMFEAAKFGDVEVMQCMLQHEICFDSSKFFQRNALFRAVEMNDVDMVEWLVQNGADVNETDCDVISLVHLATKNESTGILKILLEGGADANIKPISGSINSLEAIFEEKKYIIDKEAVKCVELLLQHGATFDITPWYGRTVFDRVFRWWSDETGRMLTSQLAVFKMVGTSVLEPFVICNRERPERQRRLQAELEEFYQLCLQVLKTKLFENLSLLDLLNASGTRLNSLVRSKMFVSRVKTNSSKHKLSETHAFYYKTLMKRIDKAVRVVKLEDKAILVVCKLSRCTYNQCYNFAREIVSYLKEHELEKLVQV